MFKRDLKSTDSFMSVRPIVILPGYLAAAVAYEPLRQTLEAKGYPARLVPLQVKDWLPTLGGQPVTPILNQLAQTIQTTCAEFKVETVTLLGHSAGGWIARIYLGSIPYNGKIWAGRQQIACLVSLGTPHRSYERWTRTNLNFVNQHYPGAFWPHVNYICVAGSAVQGQAFRWADLPQWNWSQWIAYNSYNMTLAQGDTWGDGITPIQAAHLEGAMNLTLDGVFHAPNQDHRPWYGSESVLPRWLELLS